jgi:5-oxoprolinase (ATP-hydrolysing)
VVAARVESFDVAAGLLSLDAPVELETGTVFELFADEEAPILAARLVTGTPLGRPLPPIAMRLGTTRATNALLERRGGRVAAFLTQGLGDLLEIGTQQRPDIFALRIVKPPPIHEWTIEVPGRLAADGSEITPLDLAAVEAGARSVLAAGARVAAVALMHSWIDPRHERAVGSLLRGLGFERVSLSSDLAPLIRVLPRAQTAVVNAYLAPVIDGYVARVGTALGHERASGLRLMTSAGGLVGASEFRPKDSLLSGPAGGVVGAAAAGLAAGFARSIAFDMGGTSTDVSRFDGGHALTFEHEVGGVSIVAPALAIESVAAGGGSICRAVEGSLQVGPQSAGADPGPACYGAGGPLTITDCNLLLGRLDPAGFGIPVNEAAARARLDELLVELRSQTGLEHESDAVLDGLIRVADERMAEAIAQVSVRQGYNPADYALVCFGGAGGQHACGVASRLGIRTVVVPSDAGLLSALGLGAAALERIAERQVLRPLAGTELEPILADAAAEAGRRAEQDGAPPDRIETRRRIVTLRLSGQETSLAIEPAPGGSTDDLKTAFSERYAAIYGHPPPDRPIEIEAVRVAAGTGGESRLFDSPPPLAASKPTRRQIHCGGRDVEATVLARDAIEPGQQVPGPALIIESHTTTFVDEHWTLSRSASGALVLSAGAERAEAGPSLRAVQDEISTGRLLSIARDMGEMLRRTAISANVKDRLDFSCAILDAEGRLVVNAPHIPVHLGALGVCVRRLRETIEMGPGDVVVTNHPAFGGSHLPDITAVTPVFHAGSLIAYTACRAHHAEIGGTRPGSMPTDATRLIEEGVVIAPMHLVKSGRGGWDQMERLLIAPPHPSRSPAENLADLRAQVAANHHGVVALQAFAAAAGPVELRHAMDALTARARRGVERAASRLHRAGPAPRTFTAEEFLDDGAAIRVRIDAAPDRLTIDFAGSAGVHPGNLNATNGIVRAAAIYVLRLLIDEALPLNEGLLDPVDLRIPPGMLNPEFAADPARCPAVAGGNVETSQRVVDTLLKALGLCACSQGTMNNTLFGDARFGYYETVCGGSGAGPAFSGTSAVHTHMTNTRITDPEVLERRYPVRLERFAIRAGSGGAGAFRGGDGVQRELTFLAPCSLSLLSQHRASGPYGVAGGEPGRPGAQRLVRADGRVEPLPPIAGAQVGPGDRLILETPGGGGWGAPASGR